MHKESDDRQPIPLSVSLSIDIAVLLMISLFSLPRGYAEETVIFSGSCDCSETASLVCHIPSDSYAPTHTIRIDDAAMDAHLAHGDTLGACPGEPETGDAQQIERPCTCANGDIGYLAYQDDYAEDFIASLISNAQRRVHSR